MNKSHPLCSPMVVRPLNVDKKPFRPQEKDEELFSLEGPHLSAIRALMYLANYTRPNIAFAINLLARYSSSPTRRHCSTIKHILCYLKDIMNMGLFYPNDSKSYLMCYPDADYLPDSHNGKSGRGYLFTCNGITISWRYVKQTITAISPNHAKI